MEHEAFSIANGVFLVLGGLVLLFAGAKLARLVLFLVGFALGASIATIPAAIFLGGWLFVAVVVVVGLLGGIVGILLYKAAPVVVGAAAGWMFGLALTAAFGLPGPAWLWALGAAVAGILLALALRDYVVAVGSALVGAWLVVNGAAYLVEGAGKADTDWGALVLDGVLQFLAILLLATIGAVVQMRALRDR